jgi:hypothetical protein
VNFLLPFASQVGVAGYQVSKKLSLEREREREEGRTNKREREHRKEKVNNSKWVSIRVAS